MERRLPQRFEHLPHSLLNNPIDHVGNSQPALPAPRLGNEHPADPARLIPPRKQVGLQPGQNDRPLICQRLDRLPVRTRSALVRRHLQQRIRQPVRNLLHRRRRCTPNLADRLRRSRPDLPQPVPGSRSPLFDATFNNASVNPYATSSIVADDALPTLPIAFGAPARISPSRSRDLLRVAPLGRSAVALRRLSCTAVSSTGTAFPCPPGLDPARSTGITPAFRYYAVLGLLLGHRDPKSVG